MTTESRRSLPRIVSLTTAVPPHRVTQGEAMSFFQRRFDIPPAQRERLKAVFYNAAIETRYAVAPVHAGDTWIERLRW